MQQKTTTHHHGILQNLDATAIAEKIKNKELTPQEVLDCVKERAAKANPSLNAIVAEKYELANYNETGVFAGVPIFIKDLVNVKGFPCRSGSRAITDKIQQKDDPFVPQILSTGCYIIGKSATSEFGFLPTTETLLNGDTHNPHKLGYSTGGSSGGAAAIVASGIAPIAHTMDGGGSTRIPASCCGLIGLKPSRGRHLGSPTKALPLDITTHGIVSRTVRDTANYYHAISQHAPHPKLPAIDLIKNPSKKRLKIALFTESPVGVESHPEITQNIHTTGKICEALGHEIEYISNPYSDQAGTEFLAYYSLLAWLTKTFGKFIYGPSFNGKKVEIFSRDLAAYRRRLSALAPSAVKNLKKVLCKQYDELTDKYDVLLTPTLAAPVPKHGYFGTEVPVVAMTMRLNSYAVFTIIQNITGAPSISLPMGTCSNGLPIGSMFSTKIGQENTLLELAFELEEAGKFVL